MVRRTYKGTFLNMLYKILKHENKSTLNVDGWEQGITAERLKEALNEFNADHFYNEYYKISEINDEIKQILKSNNEEFEFKDYTLNEIKELRKLVNHMTI